MAGAEADARAPEEPRLLDGRHDDDDDGDGDGDGDGHSDFMAKAKAKAGPGPSAKASALERLPDEIIQQILLAVDAASFASLVLLNRKWRAVSQQAHLYAHHLARTPAAGSHKDLAARLQRLQKKTTEGHGHGRGGDAKDEHDRLLADLRRAFARQAKRGRVDAYLRPRRTLVRLVSHAISASSCPGGDGLQFQASPRGHTVLAYNSSRIYVLDVRGGRPGSSETDDAHADGVDPPLRVVRELKILRRPAATCVRDDASVLAVLLTAMQVDLYDLRASPPRRTQSVLLDHSPRAIALSPCGSVLAAAYAGGIEVSSLRPDALAADRRAVKCDPVDALAFSFDGTQILGTSVHAATPATVVLTAPYYDPASQPYYQFSDGGGSGSGSGSGSGGGSGGSGNTPDLSALWTTSLLFPNTSRDCSHAVLLQDSSREEAVWTFTYDRSFEIFRAVRVDDLRNGTTYFPGPLPGRTAVGSAGAAAPAGPSASAAASTRLLPSALPSASYHGDLVAAAFHGGDIWLYGVPGDLDAVPGVSLVADDSGPELPAGPSSATGSSADGSSGLSRAASTRLRDAAAVAAAATGLGDAPVRVPQWQMLSDRPQNTFVAGRRVAELPGVSMVSWVEGFGGSSLRERLVVAARGVHAPQSLSASGLGIGLGLGVGVGGLDEDGIDFIDGGRLLLVDFDYAPTDGPADVAEITIEVGTKDPEVLEEEHRDLDTEVALVRRRTVAAQKRGPPGRAAALMRHATTVASAAAALSAHSAAMAPPPMAMASSRPAQTADSLAPDARNIDDEDDPLVPRRIRAPRGPGGQLAGVEESREEKAPLPESSSAETAADSVDTESIFEEALDLPYSHASPRSGTTLRRAATAAAMNRRLASSAGGGAGLGTAAAASGTAGGAGTTPRRADGRREHPHESDADNWVPPPPPYQKEVDPQDLPAFLRHNVPPILAPPSSGPVPPVLPPHLAAGPSASSAAVPPPLPALSFAPPSTVPGVAATLGSSGGGSRSRNDQADPVSRPASQSSDLTSCDLYEASPAGSPQLSAAVLAAPVAPAAPAAPAVPAAPEAPATAGGGQSQSFTPSSLAPAAQAEQLPYSAFVPRPVANVQTWPLRRPSDTGQQQQQEAQQQQPSAPTNRLSMGSHQVPRVPVGSVQQPRRASTVLNLNKPLPQPQQLQEQGGLTAGTFSSLVPQPAYLYNSAAAQAPPRAATQPPQPRNSTPPPVEDQPLIISTPRGVTGAFDSPSRTKSAHRHEQQPEPTILAPIPRRPKAQERSAELRERLETLSAGPSARTSVEAEEAEQQQQQQPPLLGPPLADSGGSAEGTSTGTATRLGLGRKLSRAERSAAKNMADAKRRGWRRKNSSASTSSSSRRKAIKKKQLKQQKQQGKGKGVAGPSSGAVGEPAAAASGSGGGGGGLLHPLTQGRRRGTDKSLRQGASGTHADQPHHAAHGVDAASSVWTDVTATTVPYGQADGPPPPPQAYYMPPMPSIPGGGPGSSSAYAMQQLQLHIQQQRQQQQQQQQQQQPHLGAPLDKTKNGKCVVM